MAASTYIPAPRVAMPVPRALAAVAAARTAPRGSGLAPVVPLPLRGDVASDSGPVPVPASRSAATAPSLRIVAAPAGGRTRRRTLGLAVLAATVVLGLSALVSSAVAGPAEIAVAGHVVLQPGETLWDVAVRSAPAGVDPRRQLDDIRRVNGFGPGALDAWTVVMIPAR